MFKSSIMQTSVALLHPLLITVIVKLTKSPTRALVTLPVLITAKSTLVFTVMFVSLKLPVAFSVELTKATLINVPLFKIRTTTHTIAEAPLFNLEMFQITF